MIDPVTAAVLAVASPSPAAIGWVFLAGAVTSIGPCIAPRYIAITAIANAGRRPLIPTTAFVLGLMGAYAALGFFTGLLGSLWSLSSAIYGGLALGLIAGGCVTLMRAVEPEPNGHMCAGGAANMPRSVGAIFLLGAASAFVVSPCCTPIVAAVVATSTSIGKPLVGTLLLLAYAAGHALPLFFAGRIGAGIGRIIPRGITAQAPAIVGAVLMLALGLYYGALA
jgi:cytochrome c-type biogenesis protein